MREENDRTEETGEPFSVEYRMIARDGRVVWFRDEAVLVCDGADGTPRYWQGVMIDITAAQEPRPSSPRPSPGTARSSSRCRRSPTSTPSRGP